MLMERLIKTQLSDLKSVLQRDNGNSDIWKIDAEQKLKSKQYSDQRCRARIKDIKVGDTIVVKQKKTKTSPP